MIIKRGKRYRLRRYVKVLCVCIKGKGSRCPVDDMTKEQLKNYIKMRLLRRYARRYKDDLQWAWQLIKDAVSAASAAEKLEIIKALENVSIVRKAINKAADDEADTMLQDDSLDLAELVRILGD